MGADGAFFIDDDLVDELSVPGAIDWRSRLLWTAPTKTSPARPKACLSNALLMVRYLPALRRRLGYDVRRISPVWVAPPPWAPTGSPRELRDEDSVELALWLADTERVAFPEAVVSSAVIAEAKCRPFDDVADWLGSLEWDGEDRASFWLERYLGASPSGYCSATGRAWLISAVARALNPGCKADHMLVLEGPQGARKSSVLAALAGDRFFSELAIDVDSKDSVLAVHGPWIIEWAELVGHGRREAESTKAFISRRVDRFRPPYGRATGDYPRRCVIVGSTNAGQYLSDPTGGRRYWPVKVGQIELEALRRDREQLWAEAVHAYRAGEPWWLSEAAEGAACSEQEDRLERDPWEDVLSEELTTGPSALRDVIPTKDLLALCHVPLEQQHPGNARRIAAIMGRLGWTRGQRQVEGQRARGYVRPGCTDE